MIRDNGRLHLEACLAHDELDAFNHGQLPQDKLESVAEHLSGCEKCASSLHELQAMDTVLMRLRDEPAPPPLLTEAQCRQLEDRARAIPLEQTGTATVTHGTVADQIEGLLLPAVFGPYLLLERLGQGGMGIVYKARQESLKRLVALKMVRAGVYASAEERMRFHREGEVIARLQHAHIVQIHEFGEHDGQLFFSMELLEGGSLASKLNGRPLPEREAAELVRTLANAVQTAHQQDIVHRDLKPGNVLFAADGTARITDFGLAKVLDGESSDTRTDAILGTPSYMAPEQARGENRGIGPAADVYALGVILYEALTGRPPFRAETRFQTLDLVRACEPEVPSRHRPGLARDLEAICLKCLEKDPTRRYAGAAELADDLDRWLRGDPTRVRPLGRAGHIWRGVRRRPRLYATAILLVVLGLTGPLAWFRFDPQRPIRNIERRLDRGEAVTLIGPTGGPRWSRWGLRQGVTNSVRLEDEVFSVSGLDSTVLTLLPDPQRSYRFSAEVRHEHMTPLGAVGLAFLHSRHDTPRGTEHCLCTLTFNDLEARFPDPINGQMLSQIDFKVLCASESGSDRVAQAFVKHFVPAAIEKPSERPWRPLAVEVRPEGVDLFWKEDHLTHMPHEKILEEFQNAKKELVGNRMIDPLPALRPAFSPRDALGLIVLRSQASFRHVEVTPLPQP
jgi:eukaryotic-like serine/threonine-protein kinase